MLFCKELFQIWNFSICCREISYYATKRAIIAPKTDSGITEIYKTNYIIASLRVYITKLKNQKFEVENISLDHLLKVNKILMILLREGAMIKIWKNIWKTLLVVLMHIY